MCGRYLSVSKPEQLAERFEVDEVRTEALPERYNVAPSTDVYAIIETDGKRRLGTLRWGFAPPWNGGSKRSREPINARVESIATSRMFGPAFRERRCLLPADGFYEWQDRGDGRRKQPFHIAAADGAPFAFAGVWTVRRDQEAGQLFSTAIVTRDAPGEMESIHSRLPAILPAALWEEWLTADPDDAPHLAEAVATASLPRLVATPVNERVNNLRNEGPQLLEPGRIED